MGYPRSPVPQCLPVTMALMSSRTGITLGFTWSFILPPSKELTSGFKGKGLMRASRCLLQFPCLLLTPHKLTPGKCLPSARPHVPSSTSDHSPGALIRGDAIACFKLLKLVVPLKNYSHGLLYLREGTRHLRSRVVFHNHCL